jgi:hypothetical protein
MEQSPSSDANNSLGSQQILRILTPEGASLS